MSEVFSPYGIILAAGAASRYGTAEQKLCLPWRGRPLVAHVAAAALASRLERVFCVSGYRWKLVAEAVRAFRGQPRFKLLHNRLYRQGCATTIQAGLAALPDTATHACFLLGDRPAVPAALIDRLIALAEEDPAAAVLSPTLAGAPAWPILCHRDRFPALAALTGDRGLEACWRPDDPHVRTVPVTDGQTQIDIDTPGDYQALLDAGTGAEASP